MKLTIANSERLKTTLGWPGEIRLPTEFDLAYRRQTFYLGRAVDYLRHQGADVSDHILAHVAPLGWEHVGLIGDYIWGDDIDKPRERFRPLRAAGPAGRP